MRLFIISHNLIYIILLPSALYVVLWYTACTPMHRPVLPALS